MAEDLDLNPETPEEEYESPLLESTLAAVDEAFDEAEQKLTQGGTLDPFTVLVTDEGYELDDHPGETPEECFASAGKLVKESGASAYAFCYDGYVELDDGTERNALICEAADAGDAQVFAAFYDVDEEGNVSVEDGLYDLGPKDSLLA